MIYRKPTVINIKAEEDMQDIQVPARQSSQMTPSQPVRTRLQDLRFHISHSGIPPVTPPTAPNSSMHFSATSATKYPMTHDHSSHSNLITHPTRLWSPYLLHVDSYWIILWHKTIIRPTPCRSHPPIPAPSSLLPCLAPFLSRAAYYFWIPHRRLQSGSCWWSCHSPLGSLACTRRCTSVQSWNRTPQIHASLHHRILPRKFQLHLAPAVLNNHACTLAMEISFFIELAIILILFCSLFPSQIAFQFTVFLVNPCKSVSIPSLLAFAFEHVINHSPVVLETRRPVMSVFIVGLVLAHSAVVECAIGLNVMAVAVCDSLFEITDEDCAILIVHSAISVGSAILSYEWGTSLSLPSYTSSPNFFILGLASI